MQRSQDPLLAKGRVLGTYDTQVGPPPAAPKKKPPPPPTRRDQHFQQGLLMRIITG